MSGTVSEVSSGGVLLSGLGVLSSEPCLPSGKQDPPESPGSLTRIPGSSLSSGKRLAFPWKVPEGFIGPIQTARLGYAHIPDFSRPTGEREVCDQKWLLAGLWEETRALMREQSRSEQWERVHSCLMDSTPTNARCQGCGVHRVVLKGSCSSRVCPLCQWQYPRRKVRRYRDLLDPCPWVGHLVVTLPDVSSELVKPRDATPLLRDVAGIIEDHFDPVMPAFVSSLHWTGDSDPTRQHVHVHTVVGGLGTLGTRGPLASIDHWIPEPKRLELLARVENALNIPAGQGNVKWKYHRSGAEVPLEVQTLSWLLYALRPQGCGDLRSLVRWTLPRVRSLRPGGALATGRVRHWCQVSGAVVDAQGEPEGDTVVSRCSCGCHRATVIR